MVANDKRDPITNFTRTNRACIQTALFCSSVSTGEKIEKGEE